jgi:hypothetical protein
VETSSGGDGCVVLHGVVLVDHERRPPKLAMVDGNEIRVSARLPACQAATAPATM